MILGAVLAGGAARRFGSDKALAEVRGETLIASVVRSLSQQCAAVVVCGRDWDGRPGLPDRPRAGLGPLGGLAAALAYAQANGFAAVLSSACDLPDLPTNLVERLGPAPSFVDDCPIVGLWPSADADSLAVHLAEGGRRSMRGWGEAIGARAVDIGRPLANINRPEDLANYVAKA